MKHFIFFIILVGCGHQTHTVGGITSVAKQNTILAYNDYMDEELYITGLVYDVGVDSSIEQSLGIKDDDSISLTLEGGDDLYPFVVLVDSLDSYNAAVCFFNYDDSEQAAHFRTGMNANVSGRVYRFVKRGEQVFVVLVDCEVE